MKLKIIDPDHLLAVLTQEEAQTLGILEADRGCPLRFSSFHSRLAAARILSIACSRGFACENRRITLRVLPSAEDQVLLLFTLEKPQRRTFRIRHRAEPAAFAIENAGVLLDVLDRLRRTPAAAETEFLLYKLEKTYALVFAPPATARRVLFTLLGEYGACLGRGTALAAFAAEHGRLLLQFLPTPVDNPPEPLLS